MGQLSGARVAAVVAGSVAAACMTPGAVAAATDGDKAAGAPQGITSSVEDAWCTPGDGAGELGAALRLSENGKRGVTRMRVTWIVTDASSAEVLARKTKRSKRFADTRAGHRFRTRHSFDLEPGTYELRVRLSWLRGERDWHRRVAGTCDLTTPDAPPPPPPDLPPNVPPPPGIAAGPDAPATPRLHGSRRTVVTSDGQTVCQGGQVSALAPGARADRDEYVWWLSELWWWDPGTQRWYVDSQSDYAYARAINGVVSSSGAIMGMPVWRGYPNAESVSQRTYTGAAPGYYYTAVNWFWTESGGWAGFYTDHGQGAWYCYLG